MKSTARHPSRVSLAASVRTRLTLWYLAVMAFVVICFGISFYVTQTFLTFQVSASRLDTQLYEESDRFTGVYTQALLAHQALANLKLNQSSAQEIVLLLSPAGTVLDARGPLTSSLIQQLQARAVPQSSLIDLAVTPNQHHGWWNDTTYSVLITPVLNRNTHLATLLVGLPSGHSVSFLALWLFQGILALLVAALGGYWLAGKALHPVQMITRTANEISATDLRRRLHLQRRDEFGELAATFDQMLARLEAAFKRQAQFTADASHELRTPLTIVNLEINRALTQAERPEEYRQALEQIQAENIQMTAIVNRLLELSRVDTGKMTLDLQEVDLSDLALASVERLLPLASQSQISLATGDLPEVLVRGDAHYLGQMLTNLIENGIKYSSGIGKRVSVEVACEYEHWGVIRVRDDGPGIAEEHLPALFERFYRVDKARQRRAREDSGGAGLGLSIVQWIVQAHGGEIRVESQIGAGTLFEIRLPRLHRSEAEALMTNR